MSENTSLELLKEWVQKQDHLPYDNIDDHLLSRFLHCSNNSIEQTKMTLEKFFTMRGDSQEFFQNRDPLLPSIQNIFKIIDIIPLPKTTPEGYKVFVYRLEDPNPDSFNHLDYVRTFFDIADTRIKTEKELPSGEVPIFDMTGFSLRHMTRLSLPSLRKQMQYVQEAHPVKLRQIHIINTLPILERVMMMFRPLMKKEVAQMLHFHIPNSTTLYDFIPKEILPNEYGGQAGTLKELKQIWVNKVISEREWLISNPWHADESKRAARRNNEDKVMEGSFRSLSID
ncbi:alpha-tocopherol transfer protein-like [Nilaparvata lugens]|uniref:alpha-tocopherol transfer protein-like n=1 Tax=Nilaparvata lugens TaxID=108931 RepID=UPI00193E5CA3|nr:alpha-tocopherol transfer protein-like [Nilaparvata lugens]